MWLPILLLLSGAAAALPSQDDPGLDRVAAITRLCHDAVHRGDAGGLSVAVWVDGDPLVSEGFGYLDANTLLASLEQTGWKDAPGGFGARDAADVRHEVGTWAVRGDRPAGAVPLGKAAHQRAGPRAVALGDRGRRPCRTDRFGVVRGNAGESVDSARLPGASPL